MLVDLDKRELAMLRKHVSQNVLMDCANLRRISTTIMPEWPTDDYTENTSGRDLYTWIHSRRTDGRPIALKLIKWKKGWDHLVDCLFLVIAFFILFPAH